MANAVGAPSRLSARPGFGPALTGSVRQRLVQPLMLFSAGEDERRAIPSMPGQYLLSLTEAVREARVAAREGLAGVLLFAAPDRHDETAVLAAEPGWLIPRAARAIKDAVPELGVATDVCVCAYTSHGQCVLFGESGPDVAATHQRLGEIAVSHAQAGADLLLLSGMLEGAVGATRRALAEAGAAEAAVAGVVKFASLLYEPYRVAVGIQRGPDRAVPLIPLGDTAAAAAQAARHVAEGADLVVVKPGLVSHDVVTALRGRGGAPVAAFHVAGEYAMLRAVEESGLESRRVAAEAALASRRAGADLVVTYGALEVAEVLADDA